MDVKEPTMTSSLPRHALCWLSLAAVASACGSTDPTGVSGSTTGSGGHGAGAAGLSLPQFVHGAARVDTSAFPQIPVVIAVSGATPDSVVLTVDGAPTTAALDGDRFVATVDASPLDPGPHAVIAEAKSGGRSLGTV